MATSAIDGLCTNVGAMNWTKGAKVIDITQKAIRPFVENEVKEFHSHIKSKFRHKNICGKCKSTNAEYCFTHICSDITFHIKSAHRFSQPCYMNSDIEQWLNDPWEIAKCYMSRSKDLERRSGSDIDFSSLLNVVINNKRFENLIPTVDMTAKNNIFCKGRDARNEVMHSRSFQLTEPELNNICNIFIDIVNKIGTDKTECVAKIEKLRDTPLELVTTDELDQLKEHIARYQEYAEESKKKWRQERTKGPVSTGEFLDDKIIIKRLRQIAKKLGQPEILRFINIIMTAVVMKPYYDDTKVEELIDELTDLTILRKGISDKLIKQGIGSLLKLIRDTKLATETWNDGMRKIFGRVISPITAGFGESDIATRNKYLEILKDGYAYVRHIHLMVVGMFKVGKTTVIRRLCNEGVSDVRSTVGIDLVMNANEVDYKNEGKLTEKVDTLPKEPMKPNVKVPSLVEAKNLRAESEPNTEEFTLSIWDFAGKSTYYSTHHFFLNARAIYLLVLNISQNLDAPVQEDLYNDGLDIATSMPKGFTCRDAFKFWMDSIYTYTTSRKDNSKIYRPSIVLVGTFKDAVKEKYGEECMKDENFLESYKENYFGDALESFTNSEVIKLVHPKKFFVSRDDTEEVFSSLKTGLFSIAEGQPCWDEAVPMKWVLLKRIIEKRKRVNQAAVASQNNTHCSITNERNAIDEKQCNTKSKDLAENKEDDTDNTRSKSNALMELEELEEIDKNTEFPLADRKQIQLFLNFQHALGNVLYYDAKQLEDTIILDPQWILNVFKLFLTHGRDTNPTEIKEWDNYRNNAILSSSLMDELLAHSGDTTFKANRGKIIQYMEYLNVIAKPVKYPQVEVDDDSSSDEEAETKSKQPLKNKTEEFYIVPCLLPLKPPASELKRLTPNNAKSTPILCMVFKNNFLSAYVCHRLLAYCIRTWEVSPYNETQLMVFNGMGRFLLNPAKTMWLSLWWKDDIIYMQIFLCTNKNKPIDGNKCKEVLQHVQRIIRRIFRIHCNFTGDVHDNQKTQYIEYIKCPKCVESEAKLHVGSEATEYAQEENITEKSKMLLVCRYDMEDEVNCNNLHTIGRNAALSKWFPERSENKNEKIRKILRNWFKANPVGVEITELHLAELSEHVGKEYTLLGIELGLNFQIIKQIDIKERDIKTRNEKTLLEWKKVCTETPTIGHIKSAMLKVLGICLKNGNFQREEIHEHAIVKWFETKPGTGMPTERELLEVAHFIGGNYKRLRRPLALSYTYIEQIEDMYYLDNNRTLVLLLQWKNSNENASYNTLKDILVKLRKIDWEAVKTMIEKDKEYPTQLDDDDVDDDDDDEDDTSDETLNHE